MSIYKLDERYGVDIRRDYFELVELNDGKKVPKINKKTGKKNKRAGQPMRPTDIGGFKNLGQLMLRYIRDNLSRSKPRDESVEQLVDRIENIYKNFEDLSINILNKAVEEAVDKVLVKNNK